MLKNIEQSTGVYFLKYENQTNIFEILRVRRASFEVRKDQGHIELRTNIRRAS